MTLSRRRIVMLDLAADTDTVWSYLRRPELIRRWYGWDAEGLDLEIHQVLGTDAQAYSDGRRRMLTWANGTVLHLAPTGDPHRTNLTIERPSHEGLSLYDGVRDPLDESWNAYAHQLRFALAVHPGEDRRTWSATGLDAGPRTDRLLDRVGLHGVHGLPFGAHVEADLPGGGHLGGSLAYRSELQFGLRLHGASETFLVVFEQPSAVRPPHGTLDVVLSTYGLDEASFADIATRWDTWWRDLASVRHRTAVRD